MPELPEVEIVVRGLNKLVSGRTISDAELRRKRLAPDISPRSFSARLRGAAIRFIHRRGKHILFDLDNQRTLLTHLRMSGRFMLLNGEHDDPKFAHAVFHFSGGERLVFHDQRHFGLMKVLETPRLHEVSELSKLAPEPLSEEFGDRYFQIALRGSKRPVKLLLLDQTKVCGLGNIYAAEALFLSGIDPRLSANKISARRAALLRRSIVSVLSETLELGSHVVPDRMDIGGNIYGPGSDAHWRVYGREGLPCPACESPIKRITQGGRSTFLCRKCQHR